MYCRNNPIMYVDPNGHSAILMIIGSVVFLGVIGTITNVIMQGIIDIANKNTFDWTNYGIAALSGFVGGAISYWFPYFGSFANGYLYTLLSMKHEEYHGTASYEVIDYLVKPFSYGAASVITSFIFGQIVNKTNMFETARIFGDNLKEWFYVGNKLFFGMLKDLFPYYLAYSLTGSMFGLLDDGVAKIIEYLILIGKKQDNLETLKGYVF